MEALHDYQLPHWRLRVFPRRPEYNLWHSFQRSQEVLKCDATLSAQSMNRNSGPLRYVVSISFQGHFYANNMILHDDRWPPIVPASNSYFQFLYYTMIDGQAKKMQEMRAYFEFRTKGIHYFIWPWSHRTLLKMGKLKLFVGDESNVFALIFRLNGNKDHFALETISNFAAKQIDWPIGRINSIKGKILEMTSSEYSLNESECIQQTSGVLR